MFKQSQEMLGHTSISKYLRYTFDKKEVFINKYIVVKNMSLKLDVLDKNILQELERDSSQPLHILAQKIQRSKQFISYRIKRMEDTGFITGYTAMIDVFSLGYSLFRVYIDLQHMQEKEKHNFAEAMKTNPNIINIILVREQWDLGLFILTKDIKEFREFWDTILVRYRKNIRNHKVFIYAPVYHYEKSFLPKSIREEKILGYGENSSLKADVKLLFEYAANVRIPLLLLAKKIKRAPITVKKQLAQLKKEKIILGHLLEINPSVLAYHYYIVELTLENINRREFFNTCKKIPEIYGINRIIGGADEEIVCMVESKQHLLKIIDQLKEKFPELKDDKYMEFHPFYSKGIVPL